MEGTERQLELPGITLGEMYEATLRENDRLRSEISNLREIIFEFSNGGEISRDLQPLYVEIMKGEPPR